MRRGIAVIVLGLLCASTVTPAATVREPEGFWTGPVNDPVPPTLKGGKVIRTRALARLVQHAGGSAVIVDVSNAPRRPEGLPSSTPWLPLPHRAIPGAIWIPGAGMGVIPASIETHFRRRLAEVSGGDLHRTLVVYCHERCWLSWNAAKRAVQYGYQNVYWYPDGIEGWRKANEPTVVVEPDVPPGIRGASAAVELLNVRSKAAMFRNQSLDSILSSIFSNVAMS